MMRSHRPPLRTNYSERPRKLLHVPHAFESAGSTLVGVASSLVTPIRERGDISAVVLSNQRDARVDGAENLLVDYSRHCPMQYIDRKRLLFDYALGAAGSPRWFAGRLFLPAVEAAQAWKPDGILLYEGHATASIPRWRRAFPDTPILIYAHNSFSRSFLPPELTRLLSLADGVVCVSHSARSKVLPRVRSLRHRIHVVHNGVDTDFFSPPDDRPPHEELRLLFAGQVAEHKGVHLLIEAAAEATRNLDRPVSLDEKFQGV